MQDRISVPGALAQVCVKKQLNPIESLIATCARRRDAVMPLTPAMVSHAMSRPMSHAVVLRQVRRGGADPGAHARANDARANEARRHACAAEQHGRTGRR